MTENKFILVAFHVKNGRLCKLTGLSFLKMSMGCSKIGLLAKSQPVLCGFAGYRPQGHPFLLQWAQRELMTIVMKDTLYLLNLFRFPHLIPSLLQALNKCQKTEPSKHVVFAFPCLPWLSSRKQKKSTERTQVDSTDLSTLATFKVSFWKITLLLRDSSGQQLH